MLSRGIQSITNIPLHVCEEDLLCQSGGNVGKVEGHGIGHESLHILDVLAVLLSPAKSRG